MEASLGNVLYVHGTLNLGLIDWTRRTDAASRWHNALTLEVNPIGH